MYFIVSNLFRNSRPLLQGMPRPGTPTPSKRSCRVRMRSFYSQKCANHSAAFLQECANHNAALPLLPPHWLSASHVHVCIHTGHSMLITAVTVDSSVKFYEFVQSFITLVRDTKKHLVNVYVLHTWEMDIFLYVFELQIGDGWTDRLVLRVRSFP